jgi:polar amino acid transport system substrate-binding protein
MSIASVTRCRSGAVRLLAVVFAVLLAVVTAGCSSSTESASGDNAPTSRAAVDQSLRAMLPNEIREAGVIKAGALFSNPPNIFVKADGKTLTGTAWDLADAMGGLLGVKFEWTDMQWPAQLPGLQAGSVNVLWGQVSATAEREKSVVDLIAWYSGKEAVLIPADNPHHVTKLADACGLKIGVPIGSIQQQAVTQFSKDCQQAGKAAISALQFPGAKEAINALQSGNIDGWVDGIAPQGYAAKNTGGMFTTVPADIEGAQSGIAVSKSNPDLTKALAAALKKLVDDGTYTKILVSYGAEGGALSASEIQINPVTGIPVGQKAP